MENVTLYHDALAEWFRLKGANMPPEIVAAARERADKALTDLLTVCGQPRATETAETAQPRRGPGRPRKEV